MSNRDYFEIAIDGGLGNQLFKFYAGLYFSKKYGMQPVFETSRLANIAKLHPGENIETLGLLDGYTTKSNHSFNPRELRMKMQSARSRVRANFKPISVRPSADKQHSEIGYIEFNQSIKPNDLKHGYFQSWRYYDALDIKPIISYQSLVRPSNWLAEQLSQLAKTDPLVMHVRRGDYQLKKNRQTGCLSPEYYRSISANVSANSEIWIFTDSPKIVRDEFENIGMRIRLIEPPPGSDPVESMILMSNASRIAISNSTFSWWAAKFAHSRTSVYAPSKWFEQRLDPTDLIPAAWERVDSHWVTQEN
jgi:hypothetical protein